jgi:hypothetical protein
MKRESSLAQRISGRMGVDYSNFEGTYNDNNFYWKIRRPEWSASSRGTLLRMQARGQEV